MNINILGISELKWTGMGEFNSDDHYICHCGQESLRRNGVALIVNKSPKCSTRVQSQKWQNDTGLFPRQAIQHHSNTCLGPKHLCQRRWSWPILWRPTRPRNKILKRCLFHRKGLECKSRKSRNIWSNRHIWPWNAEWSRAKTNWVLPRKCTGHSKHPLPTTQEKTLHMDITRWSTPKLDWLYSLQPKMEKLYTVNRNKTRSWLWLRSWTPYCQIQT